MFSASSIQPYPFSERELEERIRDFSHAGLPYFNETEAFKFLLGSIDLTSLEGSDTGSTIRELCKKALAFKSVEKGIAPAAVCIYPLFIAEARDILEHSGIKVSSVAGAFPAGQAPLHVKLEEVSYAVMQGADEIDTVISRGKFLEGRYDEVFNEIHTIRRVCKNVTLKVILETGELKNIDNIYRAAQIAMAAGADFIKTSTGKIKVNATPESVVVMMDAIHDHYMETGKMVGIKSAGGITDPRFAIQILKFASSILGEQWLTKNYFRIGTSRLADVLCEKI